MMEKKIWKDTVFNFFKDNLIIHFEFPSLESEEVFSAYLEIFWENDQEDIYIPETIFFSSPCTIDYRFSNGITIRGVLELKKFVDFNNDRETKGVFADFYYYKNDNERYIWHTEGFLVSFKTEAEIIVETDEIIEEEEDVSLISNQTSSHSYNDLFPYIYLSNWPNVTEKEVKVFFFYYKPFNTSPPITVYTDQLKTFKKAGNREAIITETVSFIEGVSPYQGVFVGDVKKLLGDISMFLSLYNKLSRNELFFDIIETTCLFFNTNVFLFSKYLQSESYLSQKEQLWQSYFSLVIELGYRQKNLEDIVKVLTLCNFLETIFTNKSLNEFKNKCFFSKKKLKNLFNATIVLDEEIFPLPPYQFSPPMSAHQAIIPYAIGDLQLVKYKLVRYELGELASITSVMPGERRKQINRKLNRVVDKEVTKTVTINDSIQNSKDKNNDFTEELWKAIAETTETKDYKDLTSNYGPPTNLTVSGTVTKSNTTKTPEKKQISSFAKKVLTKTTQRISEKVNKIRTYSELNELEDTAVSFLDNSKNKGPAYGAYCWLNKVYETRVINYGNRMLFSFVIENPATEYIKKSQLIDDVNYEEPKTLESFNVFKYTDINAKNYLEICQYYQIKNFPLAPQKPIVVSAVINLFEGKLLALPAGYKAYQATLEYALAGDENASVSGFVGINTFTISKSNGATGKIVFDSLDNEQDHIAVSAVYNPTIQQSPPSSELNFQMALVVLCKPTNQTKLAWQIEMYQLFLDAYAKQLSEYNSKINDSLNAKQRTNPLAERFIVRQELEKKIKEQILGNALKTNGLPLDFINSEANPTAQYNQLQMMQYLSTAVEWNEISYAFYDRFDSQNDFFSMNSFSSDFFSFFLKSAYVRVIVPIVPMYNFGFLYYINTGAIWTINDRFVPCFKSKTKDANKNPDELAIVYQLKKSAQRNHKEKIIESWEILVPTSMQVLESNFNLKIKL